jgi:hypothetical protein
MDEIQRIVGSACPSLMHIDGSAIVNGTVINVAKTGLPDENSLLTNLEKVEKQLNIVNESSLIESVVLNQDGTISHTW